MERTISGMMGKGSVNHNTRAFNAKNVDTELSIYNVEFCHTDIKEVYHELFDEALERYNAKQKRSDRKIDNYYEKIRQSQQKKLQQEINKMVQSKEVMERNIHAYDEDVKWQLPEPGTLMSAKAYRDKKALPLVQKLKELVKNLTIKCIQLTEQVKKLTVKVDGQQKQISRLTDNVMKQSDTIGRLQEKVSDLGYLERCFGKERVQSIVEQSKAKELEERAEVEVRESIGTIGKWGGGGCHALAFYGGKDVRKVLKWTREFEV